MKERAKPQLEAEFQKFMGYMQPGYEMGLKAVACGDSILVTIGACREDVDTDELGITHTWIGWNNGYGMVVDEPHIHALGELIRAYKEGHPDLKISTHTEDGELQFRYCKKHGLSLHGLEQEETEEVIKKYGENN